MQSGKPRKMSQNGILKNGLKCPNITMYDVPTTPHHLIITLDVNVIEIQFLKIVERAHL